MASGDTCLRWTGSLSLRTRLTYSGECTSSSSAIVAARGGRRCECSIRPVDRSRSTASLTRMGGATRDECRDIARETGRRVWSELHVPVYYYGHGERRTLADIRAGRASPDLGGPDLHLTAGAVCVGARRTLVAFNVTLFDIDL